MDNLVLHVGEGRIGPLRVMFWVSCDKTETKIESDIKTICCTTVPSLTVHHTHLIGLQEGEQSH